MMMKKWAVLAMLLALAGCSKRDSYALAAIEYRDTCFGDVSIKCRSKQIDLNVVKLEAAIEAVESKKAEIVACKGQQYYDDGIALIHDRIDYFKDLKPNIFMRTVLSSMDVEFNPPAYRREAAFQQFLVGAGTCGDTPASAPAVMPAAATPQQASVAAADGAAQASAGGETIATRYGTLSINGDNVLLHDGQSFLPAIQGNNSLSVVQKFQLGESDAIVVQDNGGSGCPAQFYVVTFSAAGSKATAPFGTCSDLVKVSQDQDAIALTMPGFAGALESPADQAKAGHQQHLFVFKNGAVTENGKAL